MVLSGYLVADTTTCYSIIARVQIGALYGSEILCEKD